MRRWILVPAPLMLASCSLNVPPDSASAGDVLAAYLRALRSGDCSTTRALATGTATFADGSSSMRRGLKDNRSNWIQAR